MATVEGRLTPEKTICAKTGSLGLALAYRGQDYEIPGEGVAVVMRMTAIINLLNTMH